MLALNMFEIEKLATRAWAQFAARLGVTVVMAEQSRATLRDRRDAVSTVTPSFRDAVLEALRLADDRAVAAEATVETLRALVTERDQEISMLYKALEWKQRRDNRELVAHDQQRAA